MSDVPEYITTRMALVEKHPLKMKIKSDDKIFFSNWWCKDYQDKIIEVKESTFEEMSIKLGYNILEHQVENVYLICDGDCKNWIIPKVFCTTLADK